MKNSIIKIPWVVKRLTQMIIVLLGVSLLTFIFISLAPGDAANKYVGPNVPDHKLEQIRNQYGLDQSWPIQYIRWLSMVVQGRLGYSFSKHQPVESILKDAIPATIKLAVGALFVNLLFGTFAGIMAGIYAHKTGGRIINVASIILISVPVFWLALVGIYVFVLKLNWFPVFSFSIADHSFFYSIKRYGLPVMILGIAGAAATCRYIRENMINALNKPYCVQARAAGLSQKKVLTHFALRNALLPLVTHIGLLFPFILGGSFIIEVIFSLPGMGRIAYDAIFSRDIPVILAVNMLSAVMVVFGNSLSDILYKYIDPRISLNL